MSNNHNPGVRIKNDRLYIRINSTFKEELQEKADQANKPLSKYILDGIKEIVSKNNQPFTEIYLKSSYKTYFIYDHEKFAVKIGLSKQPKKRINDLQVANPSRLSLLGFIEGDFETPFHDIFSNDKIKGEWFQISADFIDKLIFLQKFGLADINNNCLIEILKIKWDSNFNNDYINNFDISQSKIKIQGENRGVNT